MDINFHYFAVKSLAVRAGFAPEEAQTLAEYSQLVDDYNRSGPVLFKDVPEFAQHLAKKRGAFWSFHCVTTGFSTLLDMAELMRIERQKFVCIPFHFITRQALNVPVADDAAWRTVPETLEEETVLHGLLRAARQRYQAAPAERASLIGLALLLHIFADTYAHQRFCGFGGWWNHGFVTDKKWHTGKRQRLATTALKHMGHDSEGETPYHHSIFVGHMSFGHAPDKSALCFSAQQKSGPKSGLDLKYTRDNTEVFLQAGRALWEYLRNCRGLQKGTESEWEPVASALRQGFLTEENNAAALAAHWRKFFPDITYSYSLGKVLRRSLRMGHSLMTAGLDGAADHEEETLEQIFSPLPAHEEEKKAPMSAALKDPVVTAVGEEFFWFNVFAKEVRDAVNGETTPL